MITSKDPDKFEISWILMHFGSRKAGGDSGRGSKIFIRFSDPKNISLSSHVFAKR